MTPEELRVCGLPTRPHLGRQPGRSIGIGSNPSGATRRRDCTVHTPLALTVRCMCWIYRSSRSLWMPSLPGQMRPGCRFRSVAPGVIPCVHRRMYAAELGIRTIQVALPSWVPLNDSEMLHFFESLQNALPETKIVHYNIARAGRFLRGCDYRAIAEVAECDRQQAHRRRCGLADRYRSGDSGDGALCGRWADRSGALFGAKGYYSFTANLSPHFSLELWRCCSEGRWEEAARMRRSGRSLF